MDLQKIEEINEIDSIFRVQFVLRVMWYDARFTYNNLKENIVRNALSPVEKSQIWSPTLTFFNTQFKDSTKLDNKAGIAIRRQGGFVLSSIEDQENREIYTGSENQIEMFRYYNTRFMCNYGMEWYPFDSQKCQLIFHVQGAILISIL